MLTPSIYFTSPIKPLSAERRGTVLLIVLVILTIFAAVGLAFMFYAESEATSSSSFRDSMEFRGPDMDPELAFASFLQQLIFDCRDDASGVYSAPRGHSFYRNMYGLKYLNAGGLVDLDRAAMVPFNGSGRLHWTYNSTPGMPTSPGIFSGVDDFSLINYAWFPSDGFVRYPEWLGTTPTPPSRGGLIPLDLKFIGGANPPYSAADHNFMALAAVMANGNVLAPSFHRDWIPNGFGPLAPTNPNWTAADPKLKYMVLRPRPGDHPDFPAKGKKGFPLPLDALGDLRNRSALWGGTGNDSFWMYTGAPIMTMPGTDGRRYTALFAPLIIDLDGKLNITVAGNLCGGANDTFCGNSGWAPSEMNLSRILTGVDPVSANEWKNLLLGVKTSAGTLRLQGRYGADLKPGTGVPSPTTAPSPVTTLPRFYGLIDTNGRKFPGGPQNDPWTMPGPYQSWPTYSQGYTGTLTTELLNHPMSYNTLTSVNGDRICLPSEANFLYRYGDTNTDAMLSDLLQLLPINLKDVRKRNLITPWSFDRREPGLAPWLYNPSIPNRYELLTYTSGGPAVKPAAPALASPVPGTADLGRDYHPSWRNNLPQLLKYGLRIDLSMPVLDAATGMPRAMFDYPAPDPATKQITDATGFAKAQRDRQQFALALFQALIKATGAFDVTQYSTASTLTTPTPPEIEALRYLAQLAVNMVDFIDTDDYITPFNWVTAGNSSFQANYGTTPGNWVYGTELPKVVINEAYCQYSNGSITPTNPDYDVGLTLTAPTGPVATFYNVDIWAELCNPFKSDPTLFGSGTAHLFTGTNAAYRLLVTERNLDMHKPSNTDGRPDGQLTTGAIDLSPAKVKGHVDAEFNKTPGTTSIINPIGTAFQAPTNQGSNAGFYVVGPTSDAAGTQSVLFPGTSPPKSTVDAPGMRYKFPLVLPNDTPTSTRAPTLVLQRLLCPYVPYDPVATNTTYNPYITVDYFEIPDVGVNKAITQNGNIGVAGNEIPVVVDQRKSVGRLQPYGKALASQAVPTPNQPQHTLFYHNYQNATVAMPNSSAWPPAPVPVNYPAFSWLVHLDRNLISPMELLHVSGHMPHELTQYFTGTQDFAGALTGLTGHQAPWFDNGTRLFRFFEFVQTTPRMAGTGSFNSWRIPGKININTVWDIDVFLAMCDPTLASHFDTNDVSKIFTQLVALRNGLGSSPGPSDQYFLPFSAGVVPNGDAQYATGLGIGNTMLRPFSSGAGPDQNRLFELETSSPTGAFTNRTNPYQRFELLTKIYNNMTTRSNCFAVWVTVGFFEVQDPDPTDANYAQLYKKGPIMGSYLGQEIDRDKGRNVRHKMFAVVDRSVFDASPANLEGLKAMVQGVLNQNPQYTFNPHSTVFKDVVPYFMVVD